MTLYRWATTGLKTRGGQRVWLETTLIGGTRVTSKEALLRFFDRKNDVEYREVTRPEDQSEALRQRAERAKMFLRQVKMLP